MSIERMNLTRRRFMGNFAFATGALATGVGSWVIRPDWANAAEGPIKVGIATDLTGPIAERCKGGVMAEHLHCRTAAGLFDVSHMGQAILSGPGVAAALERLVPGDIVGLKPGRQRYTLLTNEAGGILDDLMVANLGDANPDRLTDSVKTMRQGGLAFDIIGIGTDGLNDAMLLELARNGNGRYYVVNSAADAKENFARQLAGAFRPAAENVKVQVRFNPQRVGKYKLIGFEKDRLKTEDFRNDSVDAAELAAAEAGNAIYQVELLPEGSGDIGEVSVRFRDTATKQIVENKWTMNYDASAPAFDRASPSMQVAGLAMMTADKLKGGPLADMVRFAEMTATRDAVRQHYSGTARVAQLLEMVRKLE
jgi:hypothetical protein